jgi:hypothetical protein
MDLFAKKSDFLGKNLFVGKKLDYMGMFDSKIDSFVRKSDFFGKKRIFRGKIRFSVYKSDFLGKN